jgi:murein DD-endopeptidase MepM/ murein hydrolase activator NlpD
VAGVLLLVGVGVLATGTDSAASVGPDSTASVAPEPALARAAWPEEAVGVDVPRDRWTWPLLPRPPVIATFDPPEVRWGAGHRGVDLGTAVGHEVLAPAAGVVTFRGVVVDRGVLVIETVGGLRTTFEPVVSSLTVGTAVGQGQVVASVEVTPGHCAPATCLHWGVLDGERYLDPLALVGAVRVVLLPLRPP